MEERKYSLLTDEEREKLPLVMLRRVKFKKLIYDSVLMGNQTFSNCMLITGKPGTGKTTMVSDYLNELQSQERIANYYRVTGHITQSSLYTLMREYSEPIDGKIQVLVLDDVDCLADQGCIELMKAAYDTRNAGQKDNRRVFYLTRGVKSSFIYQGYTIIITNHSLEQPTDAQNALLDRIHLMKADLKREDFKIFNISLMEDFMNDNPDSLTESQLKGLDNFFKMYIRQWFDNDIFQKAGIYFSIRLLKKFIDLVTIFGNDWMEYSVPFQKLMNVYQKTLSVN